MPEWITFWRIGAALLFASSGAVVGQESAATPDPERGKDLFLNYGFNAGGLPLQSYRRLEPIAERMEFLLPITLERIPGRTGRNVDLPYYLSVRRVGGVDVLTSNCLSCHAGDLLGRKVIGLGDSAGDFTRSAAPYARAARVAVWSRREQKQYTRWRDRVIGLAPYATTTTRGTNPAVHFAGYLWAHRDPDTLAWLDEPRMRLPPRRVVEVDVPPLWRTARKDSLYYTGGGRGDPARLIMSSLVLFTDSVEAAEREVEAFGHILAYLRTLDPPAYPWPIDPDRARRGERVFLRTCASCHGTYGDDEGIYPNRIVDIEVLGTDRALADADTRHREYLDWYNRSWFGRTSRLVETDGYIAPPLDGIWATAPYLHNGSVPTLYHLLKSSARPRFWERSFESRDYDPDRIGWRFIRHRYGRDREPLALRRSRIYDTTRFSLGNGGHTFGDALTEAERLDLLEYCKGL